MKKITLLLLFCAIFNFNFTLAQNKVSGTVTDTNNQTLPGANVVEKGTQNGVSTDFNGSFSLFVKEGAVLIISFAGYETKQVSVNGKTNLNIVLSEGLYLDEIVITGNRSKPRTILDSPVPIDNISAKELKSSGQTSIDHMLTYRIPSYNASNQTISDATAHFDPADLRGLGPSRTLVLINGKRKNQSALVYVNDTPGKGEVGTDMKSIPTAAIERIEVLRDGASAQYGSDAIAGVVNIILKKNVEYTTVSLNSGITSEGDGFTFGADVNSSLKIGENGYFNYTFAYENQDKTNRAGAPGGDGLFGVIFGDDTILNGTHPFLVDNPDMGMTVGQPKVSKTDIFINAGIPFDNDKGEFYTFGGISIRKGTSYALYRTPYWVPDPNNLLHDAGTEYQGFQPTFETDISDVTFGVGTKFDLLGFKTDLSAMYGSNSVDYMIGNTLNPDLGAASPTIFNAGGYKFSNIVGNLDMSKTINQISIGLGMEVRQERFEAIAGEPDSYAGGGAQSFPGLQPSNAVNETRSNVGVYGTMDWDISDNFLIGGALRYENYSDFGSNNSWKINSRYKFNEKTVIRASYSNGFRAPSLHQTYLSNIQTLVSGGTISNQGTFNNVSSVITGLGIPKLFAETSSSISTGLTLKASRNFTMSIDFYNIKVDDRVLFSGEVGFDGDDSTTNDVEQVLIDNDVTSIKFFVNAVNTETNGVDFVANYRNIEAGEGKIDLSFAANFNKTKIVGDIATPSDKLAGYDIFNRKEQARITSARPKTKILFGADYRRSKYNFALNNTYFGEVTWQHAADVSKDQTFTGKVITDLIFGYNFSEKVSANVSILNLLNVYPDAIDTKGDFVTDLGGRFKYPWEVNQFGFSGTIVKAGLTYTF